MAINRMKLRRIELDMTQAQLAKSIGVTRQTISLIESGKYNPTLALCLNICYVLEMSLDELFWEDKNE